MSRPMRLAFSNLACPDWDLPRTARAAREYGYDGLELRLLNRQPISSSILRQQVEHVRTALGELPIASLNSSIRLAVDGPEWESEFAALSELSAQLRVPSIRVWGGDYSSETPESVAIDQVAKRLNAAGEIATQAGITVAFETHDAWRNLTRVRKVFAQVENAAVRVLWDIQNTHAKGGSKPQEVWDALAPRIVQVHVKDTRPGEGEYGELVELGSGTVPAKESIKVLVDNGFDGWVTVNWLKFQHPDILEPEIALPQYAAVLRSWIALGRQN
jgi:sugar phosphate isomerase/epimerase